jgi:hypothetical protein
MMKLKYMCHKQDCEVAGFGITPDPDNPSYITDFVTVKQEVSGATFEFDDDGLAAYQEKFALPPYNLNPEQFMRIWIHTHPGEGVTPSGTDETCFREKFGDMDWAVMMIMGRTGRFYSRLRYNIGPKSDVELPTFVDYEALPRFLEEHADSMNETVQSWIDEFKENVHRYRYSGSSSSNYSGGYSGYGYPGSNNGGYTNQAYSGRTTNGSGTSGPLPINPHFNGGNGGPPSNAGAEGFRKEGELWVPTSAAAQGANDWPLAAQAKGKGSLPPTGDSQQTGHSHSVAHPDDLPEEDWKLYVMLQNYDLPALRLYASLPQHKRDLLVDAGDLDGFVMELGDTLLSGDEVASFERGTLATHAAVNLMIQKDLEENGDAIRKERNADVVGITSEDAQLLTNPEIAAWTCGQVTPDELQKMISERRMEKARIERELDGNQIADFGNYWAKKNVITPAREGEEGMKEQMIERWALGLIEDQDAVDMMNNTQAGEYFLGEKQPKEIDTPDAANLN